MTRGLPITYTSILLAILVGIVHAGLAPAVVVGGVKPNLVLVAVVLVTTSFGFGVGITWAFLAGLVANLLIPEPLGSIPLALLVVAAIVSGGDRVLGRLVWAYPIVAAFVGSIVADLVSLAALSLVGGSLRDVGAAAADPARSGAECRDGSPAAGPAARDAGSLSTRREAGVVTRIDG